MGLPTYDYYTSQVCRAWRPPTDVYETRDDMVVQVEVAGMREEDFGISIADQRLVIAGRRRDVGPRQVYQNMEINYGEFRTEIRFNIPIDESAISATYENGFLYVRLPKANRRIRVPVQTGQTTGSALTE